MADWNGAFTPQMVTLAKAIALNLEKYPEKQREAICQHALFCASVWQNGRDMLPAEAGEPPEGWKNVCVDEWCAEFGEANG